MDKEPTTLSISQSDKSVYADIAKSGPLKGKSNKELFLLAVALGVDRGHRISIKGSKEGYIRAEYLNSDDKTLINAVAIAEENNPDVICDKKAVYEIAEEYAHVGIKILSDLIFGPGSFVKKYESYLRDRLDAHNAGDRGID
jgi:hypothetical protein